MIDACYDAMTLFMLITTLGFVLWILRAGWRGLRDEIRRRRRQAFGGAAKDVGTADGGIRRCVGGR
jgi:hypothetical protein